MPKNKTQEELEVALQDAHTKIVVGGTYVHFKNSEHTYTVIGLAIQEATEKICVLYQPNYGNKLLFVRDLDVWLETPEFNGKNVPRFRLIS